MNGGREGFGAFLFVFLITLLFSLACPGQCDPNWIGGYGVTGPNSVSTSITWDPDGNGPSPEILVLGGSFTRLEALPGIPLWGSLGTMYPAPGIVANHIIGWDGKNWVQFGGGMNGGVGCFAEYNGKLIAGGSFTTAGGSVVNGIAAWDGNSWQGLGSGVSGAGLGGGLFHGVSALAVYDNKLVAAGTFSSIGGASASNIAIWDGNSWQALGAGVNGPVYSLTVYGDELIAGGDFTSVDGNSAMHVASWDGTGWHALGAGLNAGVWSLSLYNGALIAGGQFYMSGSSTIYRVAAWDGTSWRAMGSGFGSYQYSTVYNLKVINDRLYAGGYSLNAANQYFNMGWWNEDANTWEPNLYVTSSGSAGCISNMNVYNGQMIVAGDFNSVGVYEGSGVFLRAFTDNNVARLDGRFWKGLEAGGIGGTVKALAVCNNKLFAGGNFTSLGGIPYHTCAAQLDVNEWNTMVPTTADNNIGVDAFCVYNGELMVGGSFDDGSHLFGVGRWDGNSFQMLTPNPLYSPVSALCVYNGKMIAGGAWTGCLRAWDGANWSTPGYLHGVQSGTASPQVYALAVYNGEMVAAGWFLDANSLVVNNIARWDGSAWKALGTGMNGYVSALAVYNGELIAGGGFTTAGGATAYRVAGWNGSTWTAMGSGINAPVYALAVYNGQLVAGGASSDTHIHAWDGSTWRAFSDVGNYVGTKNVSSSVYALSVYDGKLVVGGNFNVAGYVSSNSIAFWGEAEHVAGDLNHDCTINFLDLAAFAQQWLGSDCIYSGWCGEADTNYDGQVDLKDYGIIIGSFK